MTEIGVSSCTTKEWASSWLHELSAAATGGLPNRYCEYRETIDMDISGISDYN
jgi:hypothetical protein